MFSLDAYLFGLAIMALLGVATWLVSLVKRDVSIVDAVWGLLFLAAAIAYAWCVPELGARALLVVGLVALWSLRLAAHITWRNWGEPEDRRYREIRRNNSPNFAFKSLYLVFGLQALLAWIISLPLLAAIANPAPLNALDVAGVVMVLGGLAFETVADRQLARFKADPSNAGAVLDRGLWRYSRHPNYFGEFLVWWGFYLIALAAGAWWAIGSPLIVTVLLLRVSGVTLLEKDIGERRPAYRDYKARTNAFLPGKPGNTSAGAPR